MSSDRLETPTLDSESPALLQAVAEHGGYAFVNLAAQAASGDIRAAEAAREMAWEQLHSGPWHSVLPLWRDAFSMACLRVADLHVAAGAAAEALRVLDMGLIMGGPLLRRDLHAGVAKLSSAAADARASSADSRRWLVRGEIAEVEMLKVLPEKSLSSKKVEKKSFELSLEEFVQEHFESESPVVISDCMSHWPAISKWNDIDYLRTVAGDRTVPVEVGKNYLSPEWKQELVTFSEFLERLESSAECSPLGPTYLAQHPLFDQIDELRKDICIPDFCFAGGGELRSINAWFGPAGTVTPLHHDPHHNILAQVVGRKYVRLYPASMTEELQPYDDTMLCNSSKVDLDKEVDGKIRELEFMDCVLEEGEMIYIPPKWWHYVRSLTPSLSVSFWWENLSSDS